MIKNTRTESEVITNTTQCTKFMFYYALGWSIFLGTLLADLISHMLSNYCVINFILGV